MTGQDWDARERAQETLAKEVGYVRKPHGGRLRVALAFPNTYFVGMSNLGFQTVYRLFNQHDEVVCERVFLPPRQEARDRLARLGPLRTLESQTLVAEFDILAFSVSFEWDYTNVVTLLRLAGLPLYASERGARQPLVVLGGAVTFVNPEPLAPFVDVVAVGEGEVLVPSLVRILSAAGARDDALLALTQSAGFYVPGFYEVSYRPDGPIDEMAPKEGTRAPRTIRKAALRAHEAVEPPATSIFTPDTEFGSRLLIEIVRGCAQLCRFCWAGYNYLPVRAFPTDAILARAEAARPQANRVGLVSIALCDHPEIEELLRRLAAMGYTISPASLRLDDLTEPIVRLLYASGERTLTVAPETGSDRLRRVINKTITNDEILDRVELLFANGIENLKLYYMIGLPTEQDEDLVAIRELTLAVRTIMVKYARARGRIGRIVSSVNPLVPKPGTAYQWLAMEAPATTERKMRRLRTLVADLDNVYFTIKSERHSYYQALLSLGDRRVAPAIAAAEANGGDWRRATAETGVDVTFHVFRDRTDDRVLPWDIIDGGMKRTFFESELAKSLREESTLPSKRQPENVQRLPVPG